MSNIHPDAPVIKLKSSPLLLRKNSITAIQMQNTDINWIIRSILNIFQDKEEKISPILNELNESYITKFGNVIESYLKHQKKTPINITWNGQTDMEILKRMNIMHTILSIRAYDIQNYGTFFLQINDLHTKQI